MLQKSLKSLAVLGVSAVLLVVSCSKNETTGTQTTTNKQLSKQYTPTFAIGYGIYQDDFMGTGEIFCVPCLNCFCSFESPSPGNLSDQVNLELTLTNKVRVINNNTPTLSAMDINVARDMPSSFAAGNGYTRIEMQVGNYPMMTSPSYPHGYYLIDVLLIP